MARPGPARWLPSLTNAGQVGFPTDGFAVDTIAVPYANPWKALMFCSGVDFFADGSAAVSTIHGDVWRVSGLDDRLRAVTWNLMLRPKSEKRMAMIFTMPSETRIPSPAPTAAAITL